MQRPKGLKMRIVNIRRELKMCLLDQPQQNVAHLKMLPKKSVKIMKGNFQKKEPLHFAETFHAVFGGGFAKELTAEPQWAKCSKRWSFSGQVAPLVSTAKAKLNLLSAPLKLVSQDSGALSPIHHLNRDQRESPQRHEDQSNLHSHSNHQGPTIPQWLFLFHYITTVIQRKCEMPWTDSFSSKERKSKW